MADAWGHGVLYPRLFPDFGFGYGQAVLNFYAPLTYVPGALLASLGVNPATAVEITIALGFVLAALAVYGSTRSLWGPVGGVMAAVAYTYFPYHLADAYLRGAVPEFFAFIWPPLILWATTDAFRKERPVGPLLWGALAWAGLIFTHNLTALMMIPVWIAYALLMAAWTRRWRRLIGAAGSLALALGLSAPLWLPFLVESRWVGLSLGPSDGYKRHLAPLDLAVQWQPLYQYRVQHGGVADHPLSWLTVGLFLLVLGLFVYRLVRRQRVTAAPVVGFGLALTAASAFMITLPSLPLWEPLAPILANLQYPWRFLTLTALGFAMCLARAAIADMDRTTETAKNHGGTREFSEVSVSSVPQGGFALSPWFNCRASWKWILLAAVVIALILQPLITAPAQPLPFSAADAWTPDRMWREDAEAGQVGATWTGEFLPLTVTEQRWALGRPRDGATDGPALTPRPDVRLTRVGYDQAALEVKSAAPLSIRLHQFHLPAWRAWLDGQSIATRPTGELGLVTADLPAGGGNIAFRFGPAPEWLLAAALAVIAALAWAILAWRERRRPGGRKLAATAYCAAGDRRRSRTQPAGRGPADVDAAACGRCAGRRGAAGGLGRDPGARRERAGCDAVLARAAGHRRELQGVRASAGAGRRGDRPARRRSGRRLHADEPLAGRGIDRRPPPHPVAGRLVIGRVRLEGGDVSAGAAAQSAGRSADAGWPRGSGHGSPARRSVTGLDTDYTDHVSRSTPSRIEERHDGHPAAFGRVRYRLSLRGARRDLQRVEPALRAERRAQPLPLRPTSGDGWRAADSARRREDAVGARGEPAAALLRGVGAADLMDQHR